MKWVLQRGLCHKAPDAGTVLISWGSRLPSPAHPEIIVHPPGEVWSSLKGFVEKLPLKTEGVQRICHVAEGVSLILWQKPWFCDLTLADAAGPGLRLLLPLQGWHRGLWQDGPLLMLRDERVLAAVAAGPCGRLGFDDSGREPLATQGSGLRLEDFLHELHHARGQAWKLSLIEALGQRRPQALMDAASGAFSLTIEAWTAKTAALLIVLRAAFPEAGFYWNEAAEPPSPPWKRLCQNLDIQAPRRARERSEPLAGLSVRELWPEEDEAGFAAFLSAFQERVPLVPLHLLQALS